MTAHRKAFWTGIFGPAFLLLTGCSGVMNESAEESSPASFQTQNNGEIFIENGQKGETVRVGLTNWRDMPFKTVKRQAYDYSCGSAAVATLVTYIYGMPTSEKAVFKEMFARGDQAKIRREGFSMLDMSNYLNAHGLEAKGYKIKAEDMEKYSLPFIALVNNNGYNHFVVVKTVAAGRVLVGDPTKGNTIVPREDFAKNWNGLALVVVNDASKARTAFEDKKEWRYARAGAPIDGNNVANEIAELAPLSWQIAARKGDMLPATTVGISTWESGL